MVNDGRYHKGDPADSSPWFEGARPQRPALPPGQYHPDDYPPDDLYADPFEDYYPDADYPGVPYQGSQQGGYRTGRIYPPTGLPGNGFTGQHRPIRPSAPYQASQDPSQDPSRDPTVSQLLVATVAAAVKGGRQRDRRRDHPRPGIPGPRWLKLLGILVLIGLFIRFALVAFLAMLGSIGIHVHWTPPWEHAHVTQEVTTFSDVGPEILQEVVKVNKMGQGTQYVPILRTISVCEKVLILPGCGTIHTITYNATGVATATDQLKEPMSYWQSPYMGHLHHYWGVVRQPTATQPGQVDMTLVFPAIQVPGSVQDLHLLPDKNGVTTHPVNETQGGWMGHGAAGGWGKISHDKIEPDALKYTLAQIHRPEIEQQLISKAEANVRETIPPIAALGLKLANFNLSIHVVFSG